MRGVWGMCAQNQLRYLCIPLIPEDSTNIPLVPGNSTNIPFVPGDSTNVPLVPGGSTNVLLVPGDIAHYKHHSTKQSSTVRLYAKCMGAGGG